MHTSKTPSSNDSGNDKKEVPFVIPIEGSLGLLALGHVGISAWRKVRDEAKKSAKK